MKLKTVSVQFVCLGNICRSPAAQGVMERLVEREMLQDRVLIDSAGTAGYHLGKGPDGRMLAAASKRGYPLRSLAKQYQPKFAAERTLILAMDGDNLQDILRTTSTQLKLPSHPNIRLFSEFLDGSWPRNVPDPYYGGEAGFDYVLDMLEAGCPRVLEHLREMLAK